MNILDAYPDGRHRSMRSSPARASLTGVVHTPPAATPRVTDPPVVHRDSPVSTPVRSTSSRGDRVETIAVVAIVLAAVVVIGLAALVFVCTRRRKENTRVLPTRGPQIRAQNLNHFPFQNETRAHVPPASSTLPSAYYPSYPTLGLVHQQPAVSQKCLKCRGAGWVHESSMAHRGATHQKCFFCEDCKGCRGTGFVKGTQSVTTSTNVLGQTVNAVCSTPSTCFKCQGNGWVHTSSMQHKGDVSRKCFFCEGCNSCGGTGRITNC